MHEKITGAALPSVMALAFLGDARHSLYIRRMLVSRGISKSADLNAEAQKYVTAEAQADAVRRILPYLAEDEREVFRRAQNNGHLNKPKHASGADYRAATGLEAVLGMLTYLGDEERADELISLSLSESLPEDPEKPTL